MIDQALCKSWSATASRPPAIGVILGAGFDARPARLMLTESGQPEQERACAGGALLPVDTYGMMAARAELLPPLGGVAQCCGRTRLEGTIVSARRQLRKSALGFGWVDAGFVADLQVAEARRCLARELRVGGRVLWVAEGLLEYWSIADQVAFLEDLPATAGNQLVFALLDTSFSARMDELSGRQWRMLRNTLPYPSSLANVLRDKGWTVHLRPPETLPERGHGLLWMLEAAAP